MKFKCLPLVVSLGIFSSAQAQSWVTDSVEMGPMQNGKTYTQDVFYDLHKRTKHSVTNLNWHLAFQMDAPSLGNVSVLANEVQADVKVYSMHRKASTTFGTPLTPADTAGLWLRPMQSNSDTSWNRGAFNQMGGSHPFDFSWGEYDVTTHQVNGDSLYLVLVGPAAYQVWVETYKSTPLDSIQFYFHVADFDGSNVKSRRIYKKGDGFSDKNFAYYDIIQDKVIDREPHNDDWHILFTRYKETISMGPGLDTLFPVTTVLTNHKVEVAEVRTFNPDPKDFEQRNYEKEINVIGSDWKKLNYQTLEYEVEDTLEYFIKDGDGGYYRLKFTHFGGAADGKVVFGTQVLRSPVSVQQFAAPMASMRLFPNPASHAFEVMIDLEEAAGAAEVQIIDMMGRVVEKGSIQLNKGLNAYRVQTGHWPAGIYHFCLSTPQGTQVERVQIQK